jgi:hypothetical protein
MVYNGNSHGCTGLMVVDLEWTSRFEVIWACCYVVSGRWWGGILYSRLTVNSKDYYYYLIDFNVYVTVLKAISPMFFRKDFDCMCIEWIASKFPSDKWEMWREKKLSLIFKKVEKCAAI